MMSVMPLFANAPSPTLVMLAGIVTYLQRPAVKKRKFSNDADTIGDRDAAQVFAVKERVIPDAGNAAGNRDTGKERVRSERITSNAGDQQVVDVRWND